MSSSSRPHLNFMDMIHSMEDAEAALEGKDVLAFLLWQPDDQETMDELVLSYVSVFNKKVTHNRILRDDRGHCWFEHARDPTRFRSVRELLRSRKYINQAFVMEGAKNKVPPPSVQGAPCKGDRCRVFHERKAHRLRTFLAPFLRWPLSLQVVGCELWSSHSLERLLEHWPSWRRLVHCFLSQPPVAGFISPRPVRAVAAGCARRSLMTATVTFVSALSPLSLSCRHCCGAESYAAQHGR